MKISEKIKEIRQQNGLSQGKLSELLELPRYIIANWEQGRSLPSVEDVMRISEKLDCSIDYLLGKENADFVVVESTPIKKSLTKLKELRIENGYTQKELALKINTSNKNVWAWENGIATPDIDTLIMLAQVFDVSIDFLVGRSDDFDNVTIKTPVSVPGLSEQEKELLEYFDRLGPFERDSILVQVKALAGRKETLPK